MRSAANGDRYDLRWIRPEDPLMREVHALRHEVLFAPFGLERNDSWDDAGVDRLHLVALAQEPGGETDAALWHDSASATDSTPGRGPELVGYASLLLEPDGTAHVRQLSVRADRQRRGLGRALMQEAEAESIRRGIPLICLNARVTAEAFYHRLGYATVSGVFSSGRTSVPHVRMEKQLRP
jgi:ribosomal protein S18 acetylase RimI-like enzyme